VDNETYAVSSPENGDGRVDLLQLLTGNIIVSKVRWPKEVIRGLVASQRESRGLAARVSMRECLAFYAKVSMRGCLGFYAKVAQSLRESLLVSQRESLDQETLAARVSWPRSDSLGCFYYSTVMHNYPRFLDPDSDFGNQIPLFCG
jgi:hypothetical protein